MLINRSLIDEVLSKLNDENHKVIIIYGARQTGKTTFVKEVLKQMSGKTLFIDGDLFQNKEILSSSDLTKLKDLVGDNDVLCIDEAQRIRDIGINLKILHDNFKNLRIIVTGSSSLDLANVTKEPLTGRNYTYQLYPISILELSKLHTPFEIKSQVEQRLIFGSYPEIFRIDGMENKIKYLRTISSDYLYKDVLEFQSIRHSDKLRNLLKLLAFQIGSEVSYSELATKLEISKQTVEHYIDLLAKSFVITVLHGFSRNLRKEITRKPKIYFCDLGIRNAIIDDFSYLDSRADIGALWENFLVIERLKRNEYQKHFCSQYFWRTYTGAELDYVEEYNGKLYGYEFKYQKTGKAPQMWTETYKGEFECFNRENFLGFVG